MSPSSKETTLSETIYEKPATGMKRKILIIMGFFALGVLFNFSLISFSEKQLRAAIKKAPCPITFERLDWGLFWFPHLKIINLNVPPSCAKGLKRSFSFNEIKLNVGLPSFSPIGASLGMTVPLEGQEIDLKAILGFSTFVLRVPSQEIDLESLSTLHPYLKYLSGKMNINFLVERPYKGKIPENLSLRIDGTNLNTSSISYFGLTLPPMNLKTLKFQVYHEQPEAKDMKIDLLIGEDKTPLQAEFTGRLGPNFQNFALSKIDAEGQFTFSDEIIGKFAILKNILDGKFDRKGKFYQGRIKGILKQPSFIRR